MLAPGCVLDAACLACSPAGLNVLVGFEDMILTEFKSQVMPEVWLEM